MKVCRKCNKKYKEDYEYCPKCGIPYDKKKRSVKIPDSATPIYNVIKKICSACLYCFGGFLVLASLLSFKDDVVSNSIGILFGLSFFGIFYKLISDKLNSYDADKILKVARIILPIILMFVWASVLPPTEQEQKNDNSNIKQEETKTTTTKPITTTKNITTTTEKLVEASYELNYKILGDYGKLVEYEGEKEYFYYFPSGNYEIELKSKSDSLCFLWVDYNSGYKNAYGTAYNNKEKLQFNKKGDKKSITLTDDVHIYNSNDCSYKLTNKDGKMVTATKKTTTTTVSKKYDIEMDVKTLMDYYYEYGVRQGNVTYFGKKIKTSANFDYSDSWWPKMVYMNGLNDNNYRVACTSFKGDSFKKMSKKNSGDIINFIGKVDEFLTSDNGKSGILGFEDCEIVE